MSGGRQPPRSRGLSHQEAELWRRVTETITPLGPAAPVAPDDVVPPAAAPPTAPDKSPPATSAKPGPSPRPERRAERPHPAGPAPKPMTGIDRRLRQKLARGQVPVDARLDLHGYRRAEARVALKGFLHQCQARGDRTVLVITGKGEAPFARHTLHGTDHFHDPERAGVLRRALTHWLAEPEFRAIVSGVQPAHPRHGGGGAFYLRLRRPGRRP